MSVIRFSLFLALLVLTPVLLAEIPDAKAFPRHPDRRIIKPFPANAMRGTWARPV